MIGTQVALTLEPRKGSNERVVGSSGSSQQCYLISITLTGDAVGIWSGTGGYALT